MIKPGVKAGKYNTDNIELTVSLGVYHEILSNVQIYSDYVTVCLSVHWRMFPKQGSALCHAQPDPGHRSCLPYGSHPTGTYPAGRRHQNFYNRASHIHTVFTKIIVPFPLLPEMEPIRSVSTKMFPMTVTQRCSPRHFLLHLQIR